jgi:hypothetical protein
MVLLCVGPFVISEACLAEDCRMGTPLTCCGIAMEDLVEYAVGIRRPPLPIVLLGWGLKVFEFLTGDS